MSKYILPWIDCAKGVYTIYELVTDICVLESRENWKICIQSQSRLRKEKDLDCFNVISVDKQILKCFTLINPMTIVNETVAKDQQELRAGKQLIV